MFCFSEKTYTRIAGNVSAVFLCPEITPPNASREEQMSFSTPILALLSGDTPADVLTAENTVEYQLNSGSQNCTLIVLNEVKNLQDECAYVPESISSEDVITVQCSLSEEPSSVFHLRKHVPPGFYVTVCNSDYLLLATADEFVECSKYCCSVNGFTPSGMKLKIVIQIFNL